MAFKENNYNNEIVRAINLFLTKSEQEYFETLLKDPQEMEIHKALLKMDVDYLTSRAKIVLDQVESGKIKTKQDMQTAEYALVHYFSAIKAKETATEIELSR